MSSRSSRFEALFFTLLIAAPAFAIYHGGVSGSSPAWRWFPFEAEPYCFIEPRNSSSASSTASSHYFCANATHFLHSGSERGCAETFSYNIIHAPLPPQPPLPKPPQSSSSPPAMPVVFIYESVSFLFDTGVDGPVHGHFMSKLAQLWTVAAALERGQQRRFLTRVVFFRGGFWGGWGCLSPAQRQLLTLVITTVGAAQRVRWDRGAAEHHSPSLSFRRAMTSVSVVWPGEAKASHLNAFCFPSSSSSSSSSTPDHGGSTTLLRESATLGSGYENLFTSQRTADAFRRMVTRAATAAAGAADATKDSIIASSSFLSMSASSSLSLSENDLIIGSIPSQRQQEQEVERCPPPVILLLQRGEGSSSPRPIEGMDRIRAALAEAFSLYRAKEDSDGDQGGRRKSASTTIGGRSRTSSYTPPSTKDAAAAALAVEIREETIHESTLLQKQVRIFSGFGLLLSPHSSTLKNLIFAHPNSAVLEIQPGESNAPVTSSAQRSITSLPSSASLRRITYVSLHCMHTDLAMSTFLF